VRSPARRMVDDSLMTVQNIPKDWAESGRPLTDFSRRRRIAAWLVYTESTLSSLPMLLLGPTVGAVIGTAVAVSKLATVEIDGKTAAGVPSLGDVLWPALAGGAGGVFLLAIISAVCGIASFYRRGGIGPWETKINDENVPVLVSRKESPTPSSQLGAVDCVLRRPSGKCEWADTFTRRGSSVDGVVATSVKPISEPGAYELRWYATEHRRWIHEIANLKFVRGPDTA
jgi:hypothetical protein